MTTDFDLSSLSSAIEDFHRARRQANLKELLARLTGESTLLLSYDEVRRQLRGAGGVERGLKDIPLDAIVGSVGRYTDFTRDFLPRREVSAERWARVKIVASGLIGLPPIEVYQIGEVYFVKDGNHRVSVARRLGATHIQAYVTEVHSRVPLTPDLQPDDLILKAEYTSFLESTRLDELRPQADLSVSVPGRYQVLLEHIDVHRYFMGLDFQRDVEYPEAVAHWYDTVYLPVVRIIREQGILHNFPGRTETDLYLWISQHRSHLEEHLGWQIQTEYAASDLADHQSAARSTALSRLGGRLLEVIIPDTLESGPPAGEWRTKAAAVRPCDCLFLKILVPVNGREDGWHALEQALVIARRENAALYGLHVVLLKESTESQAALAVQAEFDRRCEQSGIQGSLVITSGEVSEQICQHAHWTDLVAVNLAHPPGAQPLARLSSGFRNLIQRCPRPLLATPQTTAPLDSALLAYDGSPKAREALFVATYLAGKWRTSLTVICVEDNGRVGQETLRQAQDYLEEHGVGATYRLESGPAPTTILSAAEALDCDLLIMGGYGHSPMLEVILGSNVDQVLRACRKPMLICR
jgi:nucleotide-binding universal stress UspA family protein